MSAGDDGGPAFPVQDASKWQAHGMSLRDWFAGQALPAVIQQCFEDTRPSGVSQAEWLAHIAGEIADEMIKERK